MVGNRVLVVVNHRFVVGLDCVEQQVGPVERSGEACCDCAHLIR